MPANAILIFVGKNVSLLILYPGHLYSEPIGGKGIKIKGAFNSQLKLTKTHSDCLHGPKLIIG